MLVRSERWNWQRYSKCIGVKLVAKHAIFDTKDDFKIFKECVYGVDSDYGTAETKNEKEQWITNNCIDYWWSEDWEDYCTIYKFREKNDAMLFKLRWGI